MFKKPIRERKGNVKRMHVKKEKDYISQRTHENTKIN